MAAKAVGLESPTYDKRRGLHMVFAAGLMLLFLGLGLVVPGRIPLGETRGISATFARSVGAALILALPVAILLNVLWRRFQWDASMPLAQAQWSAFGLILIGSIGVLIWGYVRSGPVKIPVKKAAAKVIDEAVSTPSAPADFDLDPEPKPSPKTRGKQKPTGGGSPFDFG